MKKFNIKFIICVFSGCLISAVNTSCTKDFEEINTPWKEDQAANINNLFNGVVASLELTWNEQSVANSWIYPITQLGTVIGSSGYRMEAASNDIWKNYYRTLINIRNIERQINESPDAPKLRQIQNMLTILKAYKTFKMTDIFGDIPYTEAGRADEGNAFYTVKFDTQKDIYETLLSELKEAVSTLSTSTDQISLGASETLFNNDIAKWQKFGNSLRLRYAMRMYEVNPDVATQHIQEALALPLFENTEHTGVSPAAQNFTGEGREWSFNSGIYLRMGSTAWNMMSDNNNADGSGIFDQRAKIFFETNANNQWVAKEQNVAGSDGGEPYNIRRDDDWANKGSGNLFSNVNYYFGRDKNIPELIITAAEVYFLKAEAAVRGIGRPVSMVDAKSNYEAGIKSSVDFWTAMAMASEVWTVNKPSALPTSAQLAWISSKPTVAFVTDLSEDEALKLIYAQAWLDNFRQPYEAWALQRRTDKTPKSTNSDNLWQTTYGRYLRLNYADAEYQYNVTNVNAVTGGKSAQDWMATRVWWDVN
ncbi:hypothetical protein GCM10011386_04800 [Parapedobacter defluvii]|uniref:SusD/RagB family nutrient-binding outer membrane lipoprotein n=1 Tax=Parapedobacter defluvii TaxID=2045106 RepID=A0ABQ1L231_9SPHI|nr:SusD/RagB family nutrient-binding outer membrane lipoprotein [Parapedobacter defluvii]GGC16047.1 hypothetical protein GCM10011386_04800 [Parapedobacter defluvii]